MKSTTKGFYLKDSKTLTNVSSPTTVGNLKQVTNLIEDNNKLKYSIDDGANYKGITDTVETQITNIVSGTTPVAEATHSTSSDTATNSTNAVNSTNANHATSADTAINSTNATNSINATNSTNATNDQNGLNIANNYQKKKILLWAGTPAKTVDLTSANLQENDVLEIHYKLVVTQGATFSSFISLTNGDFIESIKLSSLLSGMSCYHFDTYKYFKTDNSKFYLIEVDNSKIVSSFNQFMIGSEGTTERTVWNITDATTTNDSQMYFLTTAIYKVL